MNSIINTVRNQRYRTPRDSKFIMKGEKQIFDLPCYYCYYNNQIIVVIVRYLTKKANQKHILISSDFFFVIDSAKMTEKCFVIVVTWFHPHFPPQFPLNGGYPQRRMYMMMPRLQRSQRLSYTKSRSESSMKASTTSGAMNSADPTCWDFKMVHLKFVY